MASPPEFIHGLRDRFAVKVAFLRDPDNGRAASPELSLSWGSLEIWVNGHNVCGHVEQGEPASAVHWYLLPFLQWLASNWDFLFHEERLPARNAAGDAWRSVVNTAEPRAGLDDDASARWECEWQSWWQRHCLLASRDGGLFPCLLIRRWRDSIELSWGDRPIAGAPPGFRFDAAHGVARLDLQEAAQVLYGLLNDSAQHLVRQIPSSPVLEQLVEDVSRLQETDNRRRLGLISGLTAIDEDPAKIWDELVGSCPAGTPADAAAAAFGAEALPLVVIGSPPAALMFGSASPAIDASDVAALAGKLVELYAPGAENGLAEMVRDEPIERFGEMAWDQGYRLAEDLHESLGGRYAVEPFVDVEKMYVDFGVKVDNLALNDSAIRAIAIAGPKFRPAVVINQSYHSSDAEPRRFTLAHELCHLLYDRSYGSQLAIASGPWAPVDIEKRANAFAAMLLMPTDLVRCAILGLVEQLETPNGIWTLARQLRTSFSSTLEHLCNLGFIDEVTRDSLRLSGAP